MEQQARAPEFIPLPLKPEDKGDEGHNVDEDGGDSEEDAGDGTVQGHGQGKGGQAGFHTRCSGPNWGPFLEEKAGHRGRRLQYQSGYSESFPNSGF